MDVGIGDNDEEVAFVSESINSDTTEPHRIVSCATPQPPSITNRRPNWSAYDPYSPGARPPSRSATENARGSLLDEDTSLEEAFVPSEDAVNQQRLLEDFLEMEEEESSHLSTSPPRTSTSNRKSSPPRSQQGPIITNSGLLLTHRRTTTPATSRPPLKPNEHVMSSLPRNLHREGFEVEAPGYRNRSNNNVWNIWRRRVSLVWIWLALSAVIFMVGTAILWHHVSEVDQRDASSTNLGIVPEQMEDDQYPNRIVLLPMDVEVMEQQQGNQHMIHVQQEHQQHYFQHEIPHRRLSEWQEAFESWAQHHDKTYETEEERHYRLKVWMENHRRTARKNEKHGPCPITQRPVFGNSNHFQDLTHEEFKSQFLNAQRKPRKLQSPHNAGTLGPHVATKRHVDIHHRIAQQQEEKRHVRPRTQKAYSCKWYDVSCNLRYFIEKYFYGYFGIGRTMEPAYDKDSYPNAIDWRELGAVTEVRAQDNCGACWAITAVETVESALFLATGELMTLSETEVILCNEDCEMCAGGWPENAFDYIMENKGIPLQDDLGYDGQYLSKISTVLAGESDELSSSDISAYKQKVCPAGGSKDSGSGSHDSQDENNNANNANDDYWAPYDFSRYGSTLAGYGYATEPCVCYTDGSGCSCDSQNENLAVRNVATYGPAVVCVDASDWQDYTGGILTSASGCSADYLDVNHCAQVVGYAFAEAGNGSDENSGDRNSGDEQQSHNSQDRNLGSRSGDNDVSYEGYWIVRNSWSEYVYMDD
eukprot:scaffold2179_cov165-Amphora_coffeaeformis.AAC.5